MLPLYIGRKFLDLDLRKGANPASFFSYRRSPEMVGQGEDDVEGLDEQEADEQAVEDGVEFGATWWQFHFN